MTLDNTYGFLRHLPDHLRAASAVRVSGCCGPPWCTTSMVAGAYNHCAAVMAANIQLMLGIAPESTDVLAASAYGAIGPGPVVKGLRHAREFLLQQGTDVRTSVCLTMRSLRRAFEQNRPAAILVLGPHFRSDWHWVAAFGAATSEDGSTFFEIADGWHEETRFFCSGKGSRLVFAGAFTACGSTPERR